jgi:hypothetical protein
MWEFARGPSGRRLDDPNDHVAGEIELALQRGMRIIPVLVDDTKMPRAEDLPKRIAEFALCESTRLAHDAFTRDVGEIVRAIGGSSLRRRRVATVTIAVALVVAATVATSVFLSHSGDATPSRPEAAIVTLGDNSADNPVYIVPRAVADLGTPPPYEPASGTFAGPGEDHCTQWFPWFDQVGAAPLFGEAYIFVAAPADAEVSIVDTQVRVLKKYAAPKTLVQCLYGAGGYDATPATVDLDTPAPHVVVQEDTGPITLAPGGGQFKAAAGSSEVVNIQPSGTVGYMYEWELVVDYVVNAHEATQVSHPYRSYVRAPDDQEPTAWDFDPSQHQWVQVPASAR